MKRAHIRFIKKAVVSAVTAAAILCGTLTTPGALSKALAKEQSSSDVREPDTDKLKGKVVILHSGDVHGAIDGYARIASLRDDMVRAGVEVIMADAGGFTQEDAGSDDSFKTIDGFMLMSSLGYTASTVGDTELQQGYDELKSYVGAAKFRLVCSNVLKDEKSILTPSYLHQTDSGIKIGFFGLSDPGQYDGLTVLSGDDMYDRAREQIDILKEGGADLVIGLSHIGTGQASDLYKKAEDIDFIIDGGSRDAVTKGSGGEPIQSCGEDFAYIGVIVIDKESGIADHYLVKTEDIEVGADAQETVDKVKERIGNAVAIGSTDGAAVSADDSDLQDDDEGADEARDEAGNNMSEKEENGTDDKAEVKTEAATESSDKSKDKNKADIEDLMETEKNEADAADDTGNESASETDGKAGDSVSSGDDGTYEVVQGDCLWKIAEKHLGDGSRWTEIYELNINIISNPSLIYVGQQLVLPPG